MVDGRWDDVVLHGKEGDHGLHGTGGTEKVTCHRLCAADIELESGVAKHLLDGLGLGDIAYMGRCAMHVDVVDVLRLQAGVFQRSLHHQFGTEALGMGGGDVIGVGTHALAHHLGIDLGTTGLGMLQFLEDEAAGTLGHHKPVAALAERT